MSIAQWNTDASVPGAPSSDMTGPPNSTELSASTSPEAPMENESRSLHRIQEVRNQQAVTLRTAARRMSVPMEQVRNEEHEEADIRLSDLYRWQKALGVPVGDLLVDLDAPLSLPVLQRARLLKMMKTVLSIKDSAKCEEVKLLSGMLADQLLELMPELKEVSAWHTVGQRRTMEEMGRIADRPFSAKVFNE